MPCLKFFLFFQHPYLDKRYKYRQHKGMTQFHLMSVVIHLCIFGRGAFLKGTPEFISPVSEKTFFSVTKNVLFQRCDWNHLMTDSLKPMHSIFCKNRV